MDHADAAAKVLDTKVIYAHIVSEVDTSAVDLLDEKGAPSSFWHKSGTAKKENPPS